ncbi:hypothetical protein AK812_SmicGene21183 [Symbiodinium microadriaticum]|uniref:Uncharacterized protein n=1 Tax=Symbiodinium microadriaticum TaxID=2951 RepID=A0A1Q9DN63_SYMMI|nr:hypothetical protein AK812_SmicGene21183 [Symbiodinium microadriaticum]
MESLTRNRRGAGGKSAEEASAAREHEYRAALSQAGTEMAPGIGDSGASMNGVRPGESSPGALEAGTAGEAASRAALPVANPFHSERVRAEVDLIRNRPPTLDKDASRLGLEPEDGDLGVGGSHVGAEPDYSGLLEPASAAQPVPRVARVESSTEGPGPSPGREEWFGKDAEVEGLTGCRVEGMDRVIEGEAADEELKDGNSGNPIRSDDARELIPAGLDKAERLENLLLQVLEENKSLKRRLEHETSSDVQSFLAAEFPGQGYQKWLTADPLGRLGLDPVKEDIIMNRWLSTASILFRILCLYQPGGSSERAHLLSQLVTPEVCKSFPDAVRILRRWQQSLQRAGEVGASLPDASLPLKGVDASTVSLLATNPMIAFRVNSYRHSVALDYNPTTVGVTQLVRLLQAESEAVALVETATGEKRAKAAALQAAKDSGPTRPPPPPPPKAAGEASASVAAVTSGDKKGKGKGKAAAKGKARPKATVALDAIQGMRTGFDLSQAGVSDDEDEDSGEGFLVQARIGLRALTEETASWIEELLEQRCFTDTQCREVLERGSDAVPGEHSEWEVVDSPSPEDVRETTKPRCGLFNPPRVGGETDTWLDEKGLAILAVLPRARGQPTEDWVEEGVGWQSSRKKEFLMKLPKGLGVELPLKVLVRLLTVKRQVKQLLGRVAVTGQSFLISLK